MRRWARRIGAALAWLVVSLLALVLSLAYHLQLRVTGEIAIETATTALNELIAGELTIGELEEVGLFEVVARDVRVRDPQGREVIAVSRVAAWPDWSALLGGVIRVGRVRARGGVVTLYVSGEDGDTVSLAEAFQPVPRPGDPGGGTPPRVVVDDIVLDDVLVRGDVPGLEGLRVEGLRVHGRVEAQRDVRFTVWEARGVMTGPYPGRTSLEQIVGYFDSDLENEGLDFYARARRGEDSVRARIRLRRPDPEAAPVMELRVQAEPLRLSTLRDMEVVPGLDALRGTIRGHGSLSGPTDDLELRADVGSEAGRLRVRGRLPTDGRLRIEVETERLRLDQLLEQGPSVVVAGRARLELTPETDADPVRRVFGTFEPTTLGDIDIPAFTAEGVLEDDALRVVGLDATHAGGRTRASGRIGFDGSLDVHVSTRLPDLAAEPNVRRAAPDLRGALTADLDVRADAGAQNLRFDGTLTFRRFRYGPVRADRLTLRGRGGGELPTPRLDLTGDAEGLRVDDLVLGQAEVTLHGGPAGYDLDVRTRDPRTGRRLEARGRATVRDPTWRFALDRLEIDLGDGAWTGHADLRVTPGRDVEFAPFVLGRGQQRVALTGTYRFRGDDELDLQMLNVDLEHLRSLVPELEDLDGVVDGQLVVRGDLDRRPQGRLSVRIRDGAFAGVRGVSGRVDLGLSGDAMTTDIRLDLGDAGELVAQGLVRVPPSALREPRRILDEARFEGLRVSAADLDVGPLAALFGVDELPVSGRITTDAELSGPLGRPGVRDAVLVLDRVRLPEWPPLRAKLRLSFEDERLGVRNAWIADALGELATAEADLPFPIDDLPRDLTGLWQLLEAQPWSASVRIPERRLDTWPEGVLPELPRGLSASASISAGNRQGALRAELEAVARWVEAAADAPCAAELRPVLTVRGQVEGELATGIVSGSFGGEHPELHADLVAVLPFDEWVRRQDVHDFPPTELVARLRGADLSQIPWLCGYGSGPVQASLTAKDLLTGHSVVGAVIELPSLRVWETVGERSEPTLSDAYRVHVRAGSSPERDALTACALMGRAGANGTAGDRCREVDGPALGELLARLRVPVRWVEGQLLPDYDGRAISSSARLREVRVAPVLTLIPGIVTGDAIVDGEVRMSGPLTGPRLEGSLALSEGHLQIEGLGQHLHDIEGTVELRGNEAIFPEDRTVSARDAGGLATVSGRVGFEGVIPRQLSLRLRATDFPIRREGMVLAWLTGLADLNGTIGDDQTRSVVRTRDFAVRLPDAAAGDLQPLGLHPEILVIGEERPPQPGEIESDYPIRVVIDAADPFWVRRNDFAAQVTANLTATFRDPNLYVGGEAIVRRGTFEIFGKRFELQESTMSFSEHSADLDPRVSFTAVYALPGRPGATVTVEVTGTLSAPVLTFRSTETNDRAEIIALLISGGRRDPGAAERQATEQAASFLAGLTAGILTLGLREELGGVIPLRLFAIESETFGATRVRIGIDANALIPDFMRGVVLDAYIEGFVSAAADNVGTTPGPGGFGGGVTLEFTLPHGLLLRGTYVPVDHGSLDLLYEPR